MSDMTDKRIINISVYDGFLFANICVFPQHLVFNVLNSLPWKQLEMKLPHVSLDLLP